MTMIRIRLTHGSARVSEQIRPETVKALNNLVCLAHKQLSKKSPTNSRVKPQTKK